jgi:hypothetical protein
VREVPERPAARPNRFPDAGGYPDERDRASRGAREIDCSVAHEERRAAPKAPQRGRGHRVTDEQKADAER